MDDRIKSALDIAKLAGTNVVLTADQLGELLTEIEKVRDAYTFAKEQVESWRSGHNKAQAEVERLQAQKNKVMEILSCFGQVDGDHHKSWVIDQVARGLTGEGYQDFVREYCNDGEYTWDTGMAP